MYKAIYMYMYKHIERTNCRSSKNITKYTEILENEIFDNRKNLRNFKLNKYLEKKYVDSIHAVEDKKLEEKIYGSLSIISNRISKILGNYDLKQNDIKSIINLKIEKAKSGDLKVLSRPIRGKIQSRTYIGGEFLPITNTIVIRKTTNFTVFHELLHYSSNEYKNPVLQCGFRIVNFENDSTSVNDIGEGLNEGYTEYLNKKIKHNFEISYPYFEKVAKRIEKIVGKANMLGCYLNHDLLGLIEMLENKGFGKKEIHDLILGLDFLIYSFDVPKTNGNELKVREILERIDKILFKNEIHDLSNENSNKDIKVLVKRNLCA